MFGFQRRLVRTWECETVLPKLGRLPQTSQVAATVVLLNLLLATRSADRGWSGNPPLGAFSRPHRTGNQHRIPESRRPPQTMRWRPVSPPPTTVALSRKDYSGCAYWYPGAPGSTIGAERRRGGPGDPLEPGHWPPNGQSPGQTGATYGVGSAASLSPALP